MRQTLLGILALLPLTASAADPVGPEVCKSCHPAAYEIWRDGPHARAFSSLPEKNRKDARCTACHSPAQDRRIAGVSCETCHGPGQFYARREVMRDPELAHAVGLTDPGERSCGACHNESTPSLTRFEYSKKLPLIEHRERPAKAPAADRGRDAPPPRKP